MPRRHLLAGLVAVSTLAGVRPLASADRPACLANGIGQANDGVFEAAVGTLDRCIATLPASATPTGSQDLADAYLYKGVALVGLRQEDAAKAAFRKVLEYEPTFEPTDDAFPPRVIRVFKAARAGKTKSVIDPPNTTVKKAGIGAGGMAAIAGGVAIVGGGAAAIIAALPSATSTPTPTPTPTARPTPTCPDTLPKPVWAHPFGGKVLTGTVTLQCVLPEDVPPTCAFQMEYWNGVAVFGVAPPPGFEYPFDTTAYPNGYHLLWCRARSLSGNVSELAERDFTFSNPPAGTPTATPTPGYGSARLSHDASRTRAAVTWTSALSSTGAKGEVWLNGASVVVQSSGQEATTSPTDQTTNTIQGELLEGQGAGAVWTFQLRSGFKPGSLKPRSGNAEQVTPDTIVFRLGGRKGERVGFTFESAAR